MKNILVSLVGNQNDILSTAKAVFDSKNTLSIHSLALFVCHRSVRNQKRIKGFSSAFCLWLETVYAGVLKVETVHVNSTCKCIMAGALSSNVTVEALFKMTAEMQVSK